MEPTTPTTEVKPTPVKARIQGVINFLESESITGKKGAVFRASSVSRRIGYQILHSNKLYTLKNDLSGLKRIISLEQICEMEKILENKGLKGWILTWSQVEFEAQVNGSEATIKRAISSLDYHKCPAWKRCWQLLFSKINRVEYAKYMLERYPEPEN